MVVIEIGQAREKKRKLGGIIDSVRVDLSTVALCFTTVCTAYNTEEVGTRRSYCQLFHLVRVPPPPPASATRLLTDPPTGQNWKPQTNDL